MGTENDGFASRWSKRKRAAQKEEALEDDLQLANLEREPALREGNEDEELTEADFDDVDFSKLDKESDYTRFIKANVPAAIQKKALRQLWASDSVFEVLDGMNDYDEDFTGNGLAGNVLKTAYKVGKGYLSDEDEIEENGETKVAEVGIEEETIAETEKDAEVAESAIEVSEGKENKQA